MYSPDVICFCDIPVSDFVIHTRKYSRFGIAFPKSYLLSKGANPVFYMANDSVVDVSASPLTYYGTVKEAACDGGRRKITTRAALFDSIMREEAIAGTKLLRQRK